MDAQLIRTCDTQYRQCKGESLEPQMSILKEQILNKQPNAAPQTPRKTRTS
jgi:hypothetical protein